MSTEMCNHEHNVCLHFYIDFSWQASVPEMGGTKPVMCSVTMPKEAYPLQEVRRVILEQTIELTPKWN